MEKRRKERFARNFRGMVEVRGLEEIKVMLNFDPTLELCSYLFLFLTSRVLIFPTCSACEFISLFFTIQRTIMMIIVATFVSKAPLQGTDNKERQDKKHYSSMETLENFHCSI